jgi:cell volume regulation protein A
MSSALVLGLVGGLLVLAFLANRIFRVTRIPDVVLLMGLGVLLGPGLGLLHADRLAKATNLLGTLAIILVLFEGGLELNLRNTLRHFPGGLLLAWLAYVFSTGLVALIVVKGMHMPFVTGLLVGAALGCTSSTVVLPVLQQLEAGAPVRATLMLEASLGDVLAVLTVDLLLGLHSRSGSLVQGVAYRLFLQVGVALLFAVTAGVLWSRLLPVLSEQRFWQVLTFSTVLVLYAGMEALGANGLIAVLGFGLTISNFPGIDPGLGLTGSVATSAESQQALLTFHSELAFLVRTFFFVLIGAIAELGTFRQHPLLIAGTLGALFLARLLAVRFSRWSWKEIGPEGEEAILWMLPRGLITVVLAIEATEARAAQLSFLPGLAFAVILATNLLLVLGSWRGRRPALAGGDKAVATGSTPEAQPAPVLIRPSAAVAARHRHRSLVNAALLVLLAVGALVLWSGSSFSRVRKAQIENWLRLRWHLDSNR